MDFRILGPVEVDSDGLIVELGGPRERALLALLIMAANHVVGADSLADDLWAGKPPPAYAGTLRVYVSRLRRALAGGGAALVTQPPGFRLTVGDGQLDVHRFQSLAAAGAAELQAGRPETAARLLDQALALWRGPALADVADQAFAQPYAARLEENRLAVIASKLNAELACGRHAAAIGELDQLVDRHPLREEFWSLRILALYRCGRQADALAAYDRLRAVLADELGIDPGPALRELHQRVLRQAPDLDWRQDSAGAVHGTALPHETTSFIGREYELATIGELLSLSRLVTLTGPGGSGKSRLALRYAGGAQASYAGGVWLVELAAITAPELVCSALAAALSVREQPGVPLLASVVARLADSQALLIMDNCEHVLGGVVEAITGLLRASPAVRVLATSQSRLGIDGEASWPVPPLALPEPAAEADDIGQAEAVRLLCDRAALTRPGFRLTADNAQLVAGICRRLDGIPLAIELAAARLNMLTARQLAARLDDRFRLLTGGTRGALPRHRALLAAIEWSHDLLSPAERICLRRLAVFSGGCTLEAAEAVCPDEQVAAGAVFEIVCSLVDKSLLTTEERSGSMRYGLLESVRHYLLQQLDAAGERSELERRHLTWSLDYVRQADFDGSDQGAWLELIDADLDNCRTALDRALDAASPGHDPRAALELAGLLAPFWEVRGPVELGRRWLAAALAAAGPDAEPRLRAVALHGAARMALVQGDQEAQLACQQESLAIWRSLGELPAVARCLGEIGAAEHVRGDYAAARACYTEVLELGGRGANDAVTARSLSGLGRLALYQNDLAQATAYYQESMARFEAIGDLRRATTILGNLGVVAFQQGDPELALTRLREHLANARRLGDRKLIGGALVNLGDILYSVGQLSESATVLRQALDIAGQIGDRRLAACAQTNLGLVAEAQRDYQAAWRFQQGSLAAAVAVGERQAVYETMENIATLEATVGRPEHAARLFGAVAALRDAAGSPTQAAYVTRLEDARAAAEHALGHQQFSLHRQTGMAMSEAEAIEYAAGPEPEFASDRAC